MAKAETRLRIRDAVCDAMAYKDIPEISITEVCETCSIARSTFYRYYSSVDDVIKQAGDELLEKLARASVNDRFTASLSDSASRPQQSDLARAQILYEYAPFILAVTGIHGDPSFSHKVTGFMREGIDADYRKQPYGDFLVEFYLAGTFRIIDYWLRNHPEMTPEEFFGVNLQMHRWLTRIYES